MYRTLCSDNFYKIKIEFYKNMYRTLCSDNFYKIKIELKSISIIFFLDNYNV